MAPPHDSSIVRSIVDKRAHCFNSLRLTIPFETLPLCDAGGKQIDQPLGCDGTSEAQQRSRTVSAFFDIDGHQCIAPVVQWVRERYGTAVRLQHDSVGAPASRLGLEMPIESDFANSVSSCVAWPRRT